MLSDNRQTGIRRMDGFATQPPKFLDQLRERLRASRYSLRTEDAYVDWVRRFILFHDKRHPRDLGAVEVQAFLSHLAVVRGVSPSTQNQAKAVLLFMYRQALDTDLPWMSEVVQARRQSMLPVVLTQGEVRTLFDQMEGVMALVAQVLYGTGMRLMEGLCLRVKDVEFERREVFIREGKGSKDRVTMLLDSLVKPLKAHLDKVLTLHEKDLQEGFGEVWLPDALAGKYKSAPRAWGWQWVFPSGLRSVDPRSGVI